MYDDGDFEPPPDYLYDSSAGMDEEVPLYREPEFELDPNLNPGQRRAATLLTGPVMTVAGPGAGKTNTLVQRIGNLIGSGVPAHTIVAMTFTNKAGAEIRERVSAVVGPTAAHGLYAGTFHSWCLRLLKMEADSVGLRNSFEIIDDSDRKKLITAAMKEFGKKLEGAAADISYAKGQAASLQGAYESVLAGDIPTTSGAPHELVEVWKRYEHAKMARNLVDFDDLILHSITALRDPEVLARWRSRVRNLLVDEYQDTNPAQHELVKLLAEGTDSSFVVGDADQSVYAFRGAMPEIMDTFLKDFPDTEVVILEENYRSTDSILEAVRRIISRNDSIHRSPLRSTRGPGDPIRVWTYGNSRDEARSIASRVSASIRKGVPAQDHAVLVRTRACLRDLESAMLSMRVPYKVSGGQRILDRAVVKDALAWLRVATAPTSVAAFERAVTQVPGIGPKAAQDLIAAAGINGDLVAAVQDKVTLARAAGKGQQKGILAWDLVLKGISTILSGDDVPEQVRAACSIAATHMKEDDGQDAAFHAVLEDLAGTFRPDDSSSDPAAVQFLDMLALASDALESVEDAVSLSTVHAAKGKEWPHVWVAAMEEGIMPLHTGGSTAEAEEERRIAFVALSRAKDSLDLSWCRYRVSFTGSSDKSPSSFLRELEDGDLALFDKDLPKRRSFIKHGRGMW